MGSKDHIPFLPSLPVPLLASFLNLLVDTSPAYELGRERPALTLLPVQKANHLYQLEAGIMEASFLQIHFHFLEKLLIWKVQSYKVKEKHLQTVPVNWKI